MAYSPLRRFAPWLVRMADSPTHRGRFAPWLVPRCVGDSARGRTSQGANRLGGETAKGRKRQIPWIVPTGTKVKIQQHIKQMWTVFFQSNFESKLLYKLHQYFWGSSTNFRDRGF